MKNFGIDELRWLVEFLNTNDESFNQRFSAEELLKIGRAHRASGWDIYPDSWEDFQVKAALKGKVPKWKWRSKAGASAGDVVAVKR